MNCTIAIVGSCATRLGSLLENVLLGVRSLDRRAA